MAARTKKPCDLQGFPKRLMGLEPTTFCMAIVYGSRLFAGEAALRLSPITGNYRRFAVVWSPNGPPGLALRDRLPLAVGSCGEPTRFCVQAENAAANMPTSCATPLQSFWASVDGRGQPRSRLKTQ